MTGAAGFGFHRGPSRDNTSHQRQGVPHKGGIWARGAACRIAIEVPTSSQLGRENARGARQGARRGLQCLNKRHSWASCATSSASSADRAEPSVLVRVPGEDRYRGCSSRGMPEMAEPYASEFRRLVRLGAGAPYPFVQGRGRLRPAHGLVACLHGAEVSRVDTHLRSTCPILEAFAPNPRRILDVGCSTGGSTVAMALSRVLAPEVLVGFDLTHSACALPRFAQRATGSTHDGSRLSVGSPMSRCRSAPKRST